MKTWIISTFGLKGSWKWAYRQMMLGKVVRPASARGTVKYKTDDEHQGRIVWSFAHNPQERKDWESANMFIADFEAIDWVIFEAE